MDQVEEKKPSNTEKSSATDGLLGKFLYHYQSFFEGLVKKFKSSTEILDNRIVFIFMSPCRYE